MSMIVRRGSASLYVLYKYGEYYVKKFAYLCLIITSKYITSHKGKDGLCIYNIYFFILNNYEYEIKWFELALHILHCILLGLKCIHVKVG